jgi:hypothetical protein
VSGPAAAQEVRQKLFERVFGEAVRLDAAVVAQVKVKKAGERLLIDRDGDGRNDECWFIDTQARHTSKARPILVRAIDEDGDLDAHTGPDLDSDLYVADWKADGTADVVLDYTDDDGDGDLDQMGMYFYLPQHAFFGRDVLMVWWGRDDGDDNLLWYDVDYTYYQDLCQYRCHFSCDPTATGGSRATSARSCSGTPTATAAARPSCGSRSATSRYTASATASTRTTMRTAIGLTTTTFR